MAYDGVAASADQTVCYWVYSLASSLVAQLVVAMAEMLDGGAAVQMVQLLVE
jgi:hypothetical protein